MKQTEFQISFLKELAKNPSNNDQFTDVCVAIGQTALEALFYNLTNATKPTGCAFSLAQIHQHNPLFVFPKTKTALFKGDFATLDHRNDLELFYPKAN